jgi:PPOX class probable F420-dependent enzyme
LPATALTDAAKTFLKEPVVGTVASVSPDGYPHTTPVWVDIDNDDILLNTTRQRKKARNLLQSSKVALTVIDPANPFRVLSLQGTVVAFEEEGATEHINALTKRYMGLDTHPFDHPGEVRVVIRIRPDRILMQP